MKLIDSHCHVEVLDAAIEERSLTAPLPCWCVPMANPLTGRLLAFAGKLRFPQLFAITAGLFLIDLVIPDFIPFADEILLGLGALVLGNLRRPRQPQDTKRAHP